MQIETLKTAQDDGADQRAVDRDGSRKSDAVKSNIEFAQCLKTTSAFEQYLDQWAIADVQYSERKPPGINWLVFREENERLPFLFIPSTFEKVHMR